MSSQYYAPYDIAGQVVLLTGASSGFGEAMAWRFAECRCKLILLARREDKLNTLRDQITEKHKVAIHVVPLDVRDLKAVEALPSSLPEEFQKVDILVNNAGLALGTAPVHENIMQDVVTMIETNVTGAIAMARAIVPGMVERNRGHVVSLSSVAGHEAYGGGSVYCATKHALDAFTTAMRHDLVGTQIRVTAVSPGACKTDFSVIRFKGDVAKADAVYDGFDPLLAADIADHVLYAVTRPLRVQIGDIVVYANNQSSAKTVARVNNK